MKQLPPLPLKQKYYLPIRREIERIFDELIYKPLLETLRENSPYDLNIKNVSKKSLTNEIGDPLYLAVKYGKIWYENGQFQGQFNASTSKRLKELGAHWNKDRKTWGLEWSAVPAEISAAVALAAGRYETLRKAVIQTLDMFNIQSIDRISRLSDKYSQTVKWMGDDWQKAVKAVTVDVQMTQEEQNIFAVDYAQNLDIYVKNWAEDEVLKLRKFVSEEAFKGRRAESIAKEIEHSFKVSRNKAQFLAKQETSLAMQKYKELRAKRVGSKGYIWRGAMDERERHDHKLLEGKFITWDNPPVTNLKTGARNHAGQDFGCRCDMRIVID